MIDACEVEDFIRRRWRGTEARWDDGNCYWFAVILCSRFSELKIYYIPVPGHFVAGDGTNFFDIYGLIDKRNYGDIIPLATIKTKEKNWYSRLYRDCIL